MHIVLLPGLDGTGLLFSRFVSALGPNFETTVVRYPEDQVSTRSLRAEHREAVSRVSNKALRARIRAIFEVDVSLKLQQIAIPVLYLRASADHLIPRKASEHIHRVAPSVQIIELKAPHWLLQALPAAAATVVADFARELKA